MNGFNANSDHQAEAGASSAAASSKSTVAKVDWSVVSDPGFILVAPNVALERFAHATYQRSPLMASPAPSGCWIAAVANKIT